MKTVRLTWDSKSCGAVADSFSVYWYRNEIPLSAISGTLNPPEMTAAEVVSKGVLKASKIKETRLLDTITGYGNTYAVIAHSKNQDSEPAIIASNIEAHWNSES